MEKTDILETIEFIGTLKKREIELSFSEGRLRIFVKKGNKVEQEILEEISRRKALLTDYFRQYDQLLVPREDVSGIPVYKRDAPVPLSFMQERLWFIDKLNGSTDFHMSAVYNVKGNLDVDAFKEAVSKLVQRHETLRTNIRIVNNTPYQFIRPANDGCTGYFEGMIALNREEALLLAREEIARPFNLETDRLLRVRLIACADGQQLMVMVLHHIIADGWSVALIMNEFAAFYQGATLPPLSVQYADFCLWQREPAREAAMEKQCEYWKQQLADTSSLHLPLDFPRKELQSKRGDTCYTTLSRPFAEKLLAFSAAEECSLFVTLLTAYNVLLHHFCGDDDICVGTPVANRLQAATEPLVGFFANTLVLRTDMKDNPSFRDLLGRTKATVLAAFGNQEISFEKVVQAVVKKRDMGQSPLFQTMLVVQPGDLVRDITIEGVTFSRELLPRDAVQCDLTFSMDTTADGGLLLSAHYCADLFERSTIDRLIAAYLEVLQLMTVSPLHRLGDADLLSNEEKATLAAFNNSGVIKPVKRNTLHELFREQAGRTPHAVAVMEGENGLSYQQLDLLSDRLAARLEGSGSTIAICMNRCTHMLVAMLGVLKTGAAYVPVSPDYGIDRIAYILNETGVAVVLCTSDVKEVLPELPGISFFCMDEEALPEGTVSVTAGSGDLAYVMYTSGSTGKPKGVMVEHRNVINRIMWGIDYFGLTTTDRILQKTTFCFDVSVWEIFGPLLSGGCVVLAGPEDHKDALKILSLINTYGITGVHFVPSVLDIFLECVRFTEIPAVKRIWCSGEALKASAVRKFRHHFPRLDLYNLYGPTEAGIEVSYWKVPVDVSTLKVVPVGYPLPGVSLHVFNRYGRPVPPGIAGELFIGGVQVARGYLNQPEQTAQQFIDGLYRTGDIVRLLPEGVLEYVGRKDDQVKVAGLRIELGEIENVLLSLPGIKQAAVIMPAGDGRIKAFVVKDGDLSVSSIQTQLRKLLPVYMQPSAITVLAEMPLTLSGKADKKMLAVSSGKEHLLKQGYTAPVNHTEVVLANIWETVLGRGPIGRHDNFFELGGHSLKVMKLGALIYEEFNVQTEAKEFFLYPTIEQFAERLDNGSYSSIQQDILEACVPVVINNEQYYPVTPTVRYWIDPEKDKEYKAADRLHGVIYLTYAIDGVFNPAIYEAAVRYVYNRHESLRSSFHHLDGGFFMKVAAPHDHVCEYRSLEKMEAMGARTEDFVLFREEYPDTAMGRLFMVRVAQTGTSSWLAGIMLHHVISDTWSFEILFRDLFTAYNALSAGKEPTLPPLPYQNKEYQSYVNRYIAQYAEEHKAYWRGLYDQLPGVFELSSTAVPENWSQRIALREQFRIPDQLLEQLIQCSATFSASLFVILQATVKYFIAHRTGVYDIYIGTYEAGRDYLGTEHQIGDFARTVGIRTVFSATDSFSDMLLKVMKSNDDLRHCRAYPLIAATQDMLAPGEGLVGSFWKINVHYQETEGMFVDNGYYSKTDSNMTVKRIALRPEGERIAAIDLQLRFNRWKEKLELEIEYDSSRFTREDIRKLYEDYYSCLQQVIN